MNPLHPDHMSASERLDAIAEILAAALMRVRARKSSSISADCGESCVDLPAAQSVHATVSKRNGK
jgi:hypothetical protein